MSELRERLKQEFTDKEYREAYAEGFLNTSIATQMQVIREQRDMNQAELAEKVGTKQAGISRIENVNYSAWKIETLKKIAFALGCRLKVSIETFGSLLDEAEAFSEEALQRVPFEQDPAFNVQAATAQAVVASGNPDPPLSDEVRSIFLENNQVFKPIISMSTKHEEGDMATFTSAWGN